MLVIRGDGAYDIGTRGMRKKNRERWKETGIKEWGASVEGGKGKRRMGEALQASLDSPTRQTWGPLLRTLLLASASFFLIPLYNFFHLLFSSCTHHLGSTLHGAFTLLHTGCSKATLTRDPLSGTRWENSQVGLNNNNAREGEIP